MGQGEGVSDTRETGIIVDTIRWLMVRWRRINDQVI